MSEAPTAGRRPRVTLVIPTVNEIVGMRAVLPTIDRGWCDDIIVLDGESTDGTVEFARELGLAVYRQRAPGLRAGYTELFPQIRGDVIVTFSPDGNSLPEKIPELVEKMAEGYDMVIVSRYLGGARSLDDDILTGLGNAAFTWLINRLFGGHYTDAMVIFRAYRRDTVTRLGLLRPRSRLWECLVGRRVSWEPLLSIRCARHRLRVAEIQGDEPKRLGGVRKMKPFRTGSAVLFQILEEVLRPADCPDS